MTAYVRELFARKSSGTATVTIDLGTPRRFVAWGTITYLDPLSDFDSDNAAAIDITHVDGIRTNTRLYGGAHLGDNGAYSNLHETALVRTGRQITFRLRAFHSSDLECYGSAIVITDP